MTRIKNPTPTDKQVTNKGDETHMKGKAMYHKASPMHPYKHTSAHDATPMSQMLEHHKYRISVAHPAHPDHKYYKAAISNVRDEKGKHGTMEVPNA